MIMLMKIKLNIINIGRILVDKPCRILFIGSGSGKTNVLLNLIENQPDIDKINLYATDPYEAKYKYFTNNIEGAAS